MDYISIQDAAKELGVTRGTLYYYLRTLNIKQEKFDLDRQKYITAEDFKRIVTLKEAAQARKQQEAA